MRCAAVHFGQAPAGSGLNWMALFWLRLCDGGIRTRGSAEARQRTACSSLQAEEET